MLSNTDTIFTILITYLGLDGTARKSSCMLGEKSLFEPSSRAPIFHQDRYYFLWPSFSAPRSSGLYLSNLVLFGFSESPNP